MSTTCPQVPGASQGRLRPSPGRIPTDAELLDAEVPPLELGEESAIRWVNEIWNGGRRPRRGDPRGDFGEEGRRQASQWITLTLVRPGGQSSAEGSRLLRDATRRPALAPSQGPLHTNVE